MFKKLSISALVAVLVALTAATPAFSQSEGYVLCLKKGAEEETPWTFYMSQKNAEVFKSAFPDKRLVTHGGQNRFFFEAPRAGLMNGFAQWDFNIETESDFQIGETIKAAFSKYPNVRSELQSCKVIAEDNVCAINRPDGEVVGARPCNWCADDGMKHILSKGYTCQKP